MPTLFSCATAAAKACRPALLVAALALSACATPGTEAAAPPPPSRDALAFEDAVDQLTVALFARAKLDSRDAGGRGLVIDPLIDRATGNQAVSTQSMEQRMVRVVRARFTKIQPQPFTAASLSSQPLILVGSITPVAAPGVIPPTSKPTQTYRIWAALADLRTNRIVSHETAWVRADSVDMTPTRFFRDSPSWLADRSQTAYIKTCAGNPGDPIDPAYVSGLFAAANIADGIKAYEAGRYEEALTYYTRAQSLPAGDQLRVYNGIYLANAVLGRREAAEQAFGTLVSYGLQRGKLAVKFVFRPNSTQFWPDPAVSGPYPMWLRQIATNTVYQSACLRLVGHTSPTGTAALNRELSLARASVVRDDLISQAARLATLTDTEGRGSAEPLVGSGRDDATDVLDRRVEFETRPCPQGSGASGRDVASRRTGTPRCILLVQRGVFPVPKGCRGICLGWAAAGLRASHLGPKLPGAGQDLVLDLAGRGRVDRRVDPLAALRDLLEDRNTDSVGPQLTPEDVGRRLEPLATASGRLEPVGDDHPAKRIGRR